MLDIPRISPNSNLYFFHFYRDSLEDPSSKKSSIDLAPKTNSVTYCELIAIVVNIVDLKNALPPEWVVMVSTFNIFIVFSFKSFWR